MNEMIERGGNAIERAEHGRKVWEQGRIEAEECRQEIQEIKDAIGLLTRQLGASLSGTSERIRRDSVHGDGPLIAVSRTVREK